MEVAMARYFGSSPPATIPAHAAHHPHHHDHHQHATDDGRNASALPVVRTMSSAPTTIAPHIHI